MMIPIDKHQIGLEASARSMPKSLEYKSSLDYMWVKQKNSIPFGNGLCKLFMVIWRMVYYYFNHITYVCWISTWAIGKELVGWCCGSSRWSLGFPCQWSNHSKWGKSKDVYCYLLFYPDKEVNYPTLQKITLSFVNLRIIQWTGWLSLSFTL